MLLVGVELNFLASFPPVVVREWCVIELVVPDAFEKENHNSISCVLPRKESVPTLGDLGYIFLLWDASFDVHVS